MRDKEIKMRFGVIAFLLIVLIAGVVPEASGQDYEPPFTSKADLSKLRFDQTYYAQVHNTYAHSNHLTNWLDAGYRTVELDVLDAANWQNNDLGPYVSHGPELEVPNCSGQRLGNCLRDIANWIDRNGSNVPIVVHCGHEDNNHQPHCMESQCSQGS